jgi:hypothetical protein
METLYACEAHNNTAKDAAQHFVRDYWAQPRKLKNWKPDARTFSVVGGSRTYEVKLIAEVRGVRPAVYEIVAATVDA